MKKFIASVAILGFIAFHISSCAKCHSCDFGKGDVREFCPKDFPDGASGLKMTIKAYEEQGYVCVAK